MKKFLLICSILFLPFILLGCSKKEASVGVTNQNTSSQYLLIGPTLFISSSCGHCANVKKFISDNDVTDKVQFAEKEVSESLVNYNTWLQAGKSCGITEKLGVPLLYDNGKCYMGEVEVMDYFKTKAGIK